MREEGDKEMAEEKKKDVKEGADSKKTEEEKKASQRKLEDKTGRDWTKPKTFKPEGTV